MYIRDTVVWKGCLLVKHVKVGVKLLDRLFLRIQQKRLQTLMYILNHYRESLSCSINQLWVLFSYELSPSNWAISSYFCWCESSSLHSRPLQSNRPQYDCILTTRKKYIYHIRYWGFGGFASKCSFGSPCRVIDKLLCTLLLNVSIALCPCKCQHSV